MALCQLSIEQLGILAALLLGSYTITTLVQSREWGTSNKFERTSDELNETIKEEKNISLLSTLAFVAFVYVYITIFVGVNYNSENAVVNRSELDGDSAGALVLV